MTNKVKFRLSGRQHAALKSYLYPGDGKETVVIALCGISRQITSDIRRSIVCINEIVEIPRNAYIERTEIKVTWNTAYLPEIFKKAQRKGQVILKMHSHPAGVANFSEVDNQSDKELFISAAGWLDTDFPGLSAVMLPDGKIIVRTVDSSGKFGEVESILVAGDDVNIWYEDSTVSINIPEHSVRTAQVFGSRTTALLSKLTIGIIGISGTGSPVVEMLYRLGVGSLILVDPDVVEEKNVGRIYNSTLKDAEEKRHKVNVLNDVIIKSGLSTNVIPIAKDVFNNDVIHELIQCDILFGCIDSVDARDLLNRISSFYLIPYFDLGIKLEADGLGGVNQVCGSVNYIQPGGSSLFSRGVYTASDLQSSSMKRSNPEQYKEQLHSKYIKGVQEDRPAVISVNTLIASLAVNEFLARIHPFRDDPNNSFYTIGISLTQSRLISDDNDSPCKILEKYVGRGDIVPLLDIPSLS